MCDKESKVTQNEYTDYLLAKPCCEDSFPFGPEAHVFKVFNKMFALIGCRHGQLSLTLKATPDDVTFLTEEFVSIERGYHMNKKHWITITPSQEITASMIEAWIDNSYSLVTSKLTKIERSQLNN
ncbi:MmcQ/YjbR family DNA-binding protein [Aliivibrio fischeri]|nr:MmcQ/YjbR family DNA-binding protein [Aliivibrio fischeri]MCE4936811.1 MmcQ/YjbR family DNA-binding protein [Aliivibrio fischeri]